jgi:uncharacterized protein
MEMAGEQTIATREDAVWLALNDPEMLKACIPGCDEIEKSGDHEYRVKLTAVIGPIRARFNGKMTLTDLNPPHSYKILFEGQGGAAGFAKGEASVQLHAEGAATRMTYAVKAQVGGKLAQVGSRLIDGVAHKVAGEFFATFSERVAPVVAQGEPTDSGAATRSAKTGPWIWVAGAVALVLAAGGAWLLFA